MPLVSGGSLGGLLKERFSGGLPEVAIASIMRDVLSAIDYLHRQCGVTHRDVKAANLLLDETSGAALLADLGAAARNDRTEGAAALTSFAGSP